MTVGLLRGDVGVVVNGFVAQPVALGRGVLLFPLSTQAVRGEQEKVRCRERLGGLLKYYEREAA